MHSTLAEHLDQLEEDLHDFREEIRQRKEEEVRIRQEQTQDFQTLSDRVINMGVQLGKIVFEA